MTTKEALNLGESIGRHKAYIDVNRHIIEGMDQELIQSYCTDKSKVIYDEILKLKNTVKFEEGESKPWHEA